MQIKNNKEEALKDNLKKIVLEQDLRLHQQWVTCLSAELGISVLDCASALLSLNQPNVSVPFSEHDNNINVIPKLATVLPSKIKLLRYRLDVGHKHQVSLAEITDILVEVSGVDRKYVEKLNIRSHYTLVDLPDGMPADIFQLLSETEVRQQKLNIRRIKYKHGYHRKNNHKKRQQKM